MRHDWTVAEIRDIYRRRCSACCCRHSRSRGSFIEPDEVQTCHLFRSRPADVPRTAPTVRRARTTTRRSRVTGLMSVEDVMDRARRAAAEGVTRLCMGAAWRDAPEGAEFDAVLRMVRGVADLGLEVCCTLGMLTDDQARRLKEAGLTAYNHNLDTSPEFYGRIITTRVYDERLRTLAAVRERGTHGVLRRHHRHGRVRRAIASACCGSWRRRSHTPRACRSICCSAWPARRWPTSGRSIRSCWSGCWRPRAS